MRSSNFSIASLLLLVVTAICTIACEPDTPTEDKTPKEQTPKTEETSMQTPTKQDQSAKQLQSIEEYLMGKFEPSTHDAFTEISRPYARKGGMYMHEEAYQSFKAMHQAAKENGINLVIISAARSFERQKQIWEAKWNGSRLVDGKDLSKTIPDPEARALKILQYSAMPGTSRHHWGTDIDLNALENSYFEQGKGVKVYEWLMENAATYGFCQPYTEKNLSRLDGYNEEKWHWSYKPTSGLFTRMWDSKLENASITGFDGAETAANIDVKTKYVLGINRDCKPLDLLNRQ